MDINTLLKGLDCPCGRAHTCSIQAVYIENNAALRLTEICRDVSRILLVADENTFAAAGEQVCTALRDKSMKRVMFPGSQLLVPNEAAIDAVTNALDDAEMIVGVGSGVIQDLCKYVSHTSGIPYIIVATAPCFSRSWPCWKPPASAASSVPSCSGAASGVCPRAPSAPRAWCPSCCAATPT